MPEEVQELQAWAAWFTCIGFFLSKLMLEPPKSSISPVQNGLKKTRAGVSKVFSGRA
jgi:hypothetical protein